MSKPISRGAAIIGLLEFLLGIGLLVGGVLLLVNDVNDDLDVSNDPKFYGLWSAPGVIFALFFYLHNFILLLLVIIGMLYFYYHLFYPLLLWNFYDFVDHPITVPLDFQDLYQLSP